MTNAHFWRSYRGCRCYNLRTGLMKRQVAERLGKPEAAITPHNGSLCYCPTVIYVGRRRAKIMAREEARRG